MALVHFLRQKAAVKIAIVGGGASGVIAAISLLRRLGRRAEITLFDPTERLGAGLAYGTEQAAHLLNVPAARMSGLPDQPADFLNWLRERAPGVFQARHFPFVPRSHYRHYLQERLNQSEARAGRNIKWKREQIAKVERGAAGWNCSSEAGVTGPYDHCLLATGYQPLESKFNFEMIKNHSSVAIAGTGLSAIDHWLRLRQAGYAGVVNFYSRRGLFPLSHVAVPPVLEGPDPVSQKPRQLFKAVRKMRIDYEWAAIADFLRPNVAKIWAQWSAKERQQFVSHIKPYWELVRHRVPATVFEELRKDLTSGRAQIHLGRTIKNFSGVVLNATGAQVQALPLVVGGPSPTLHLVGPASKHLFWEITAIPEIVQQTAGIAAKIQPLRLVEPHAQALHV